MSFSKSIVSIGIVSSSSSLGGIGFGIHKIIMGLSRGHYHPIASAATSRLRLVRSVVACFAFVVLSIICVNQHGVVESRLTCGLPQSGLITAPRLVGEVAAEDRRSAAEESPNPTATVLTTGEHGRTESGFSVVEPDIEGLILSLDDDIVFSGDVEKHKEFEMKSAVEQKEGPLLPADEPDIVIHTSGVFFEGHLSVLASK